MIRPNKITRPITTPWFEIRNHPVFRMMYECSEYTKLRSMQNEELSTAQGTMNTKTPNTASGEGVDWMASNTTESVSVRCGDTTEGDDDDGEQTEKKKMKRILANRCAARASYIRRKYMVSQLSVDVTNLSARNDEVEAENELLRNEVRNLKQQVRVLQLIGYREPTPELLLSRAVQTCLPAAHTSLPPHLLARILEVQHNPFSISGLFSLPHHDGFP